MLSPRFLAMPAIALAVIVALSQAHSGSSGNDGATRTVYRAVNCAIDAVAPACTVAGTAGAIVTR